MGTSGEGGVGQAAEEASAQLIRGMGLGAATSLNMLDMIGVGPFITMPLIVSAMGGPQAMLGWILGAGFAVCDGLVWAELGAAMPGSGGSYRYLKEIYGPNGLGTLDFLPVHLATFLQRTLSVASGCLGVAGYAAYFWPGLEHVYSRTQPALHLPLVGNLQISWVATSGTIVAIGRLPVRGVSALSANNGHRTAFETLVGRRHGHDRLDHFRRADPFQRGPRLLIFPPGPSRFREAFLMAWAAPC